MKKLNFLSALLAMTLVLGFAPSLAAQSGSASVNGAWKRTSGGNASGTIVTIDGSNGYFTTVAGDWQRVRDNKAITIGDMFFRNIKSTENNTWSCQIQLYNTSTFRLSNWANGTLTLSADGNTFTANVPTAVAPVGTFTRTADGLNGAWRRTSGGNASGTIVTIDGSNGYFTTVAGDWQRVRDNGAITIGNVFFRNIKSTGNNTWSCQIQLYNTSTFRLSNWTNGTLTLSADGNTFTANVPTAVAPVGTFTRVQ